MIQARDGQRRDEPYGHHAEDLLPTVAPLSMAGRVDLMSAAPATPSSTHSRTR